MVKWNCTFKSVEINSLNVELSYKDIQSQTGGDRLRGDWLPGTLERRK